MSRFFFLFCFLLSFAVSLTGHAQQAPDAAAPNGKLNRREKKKLARQTAQEDAKQLDQPLSDKDREVSEGYFVEGVKYVLLEDYPKALERLQKAYALSPTNAAVNYKLAEANMLSGRLKEATTYATAAVRLDGKNPYYYLLLAQSYVGQKQLDQATKVYSTLVREVPDSESYLFNLADLYLAQGKLNEALATFDKAEQHFGNVDEVTFKRQQIYLKQNKLDKALQQGEALIASNPEEVRYVLAQAEMYASNNRLPDAIRVAEQALKQDPNNPQAHLILADIYRQQNNPTASEEQVKLAFESPLLPIDDKVRILVDYIKQLPNPKLEKTARELAATTTRLHPREAKAHAVAGDIQTITDHKAEARAAYLQALRLDDSKFQIWQQVVLIDAELNQIDSLLVHSDRALELFPNQASLWFYNGLGHLLNKQPAKGIKSLEFGRKLTADTPQLRAQFDAQLGDAYHEVKENARSDAAYEAALAYDATNAQVLNNYSYFLSLRGERLDKAREMAGRLVKQFPDNDTYLDTYAWVLYKQKDYAGARQALERALRTTKDATVIEHYGDVLYQLGDKERALAEWERARKTGGASPLVDRKIKDRKLYE